jgi:hypothetical protein
MLLLYSNQELNADKVNRETVFKLISQNKRKIHWCIWSIIKRWPNVLQWMEW